MKWEICRKHSSPQQNKIAVLKKSTWAITWAVSRTNYFHHGASWLTENCIYSDLSIWERFFSEMNTVKLSLQGKQWTYLLPMIKFKLSTENQNFRKHSHYNELYGFRVVKDCSDEIGGDINKCDFWYCILLFGIYA